MLYAVLPALMVFCIAGLRIMRHAAERAERRAAEREEAVRGNRFICEYREFGGMADNSLTLKLTVDAGDVRLSVTERFSGEKEERCEEYPLPTVAAEPIIVPYIERGVWTWTGLKKSELIALDAPTRKLRYETALGVTELDGDDELPKNGSGVFAEVRLSLTGWRDVFVSAKKSVPQPAQSEEPNEEPEEEQEWPPDPHVEPQEKLRLEPQEEPEEGPEEEPREEPKEGPQE